MPGAGACTRVENKNACRPSPGTCARGGRTYFTPLQFPISQTDKKLSTHADRHVTAGPAKGYAYGRTMMQNRTYRVTAARA